MILCIIVKSQGYVFSNKMGNGWEWEVESSNEGGLLSSTLHPYSHLSGTFPSNPHSHILHVSMYNTLQSTCCRFIKIRKNT